MITFQEAKQIAEHKINNGKHLLNNGDSLIIMDEETIEQALYWVFFYNSKMFLETGDFSHMIAGNAPLFISKLTGQISTYSTGLSIEQMIAEYETENKVN